MSKRVFVALPLSRYLQDEILAWGEAHPQFPVRWLDVKNLHVTLVPPWYELMPERVTEALRTVPSGGKFYIRFDEVSFGPEPQAPRLIWAKGEPPMKLLELKVNIEQALGREITLRQPYQMHVTLARFPEERFSRFPTKKLNEKTDWQDEIDRFALYESHLHPSGSEYEILEEFPL